MDQIVFIADRATVDQAGDLIIEYGAFAADEAAARADRSRDLGNVLHFCRWRQVGRVIGLLASEAAVGTVH